VTGMSLTLTTDADLAERFGITVKKLHELRLAKGWPCVKLGRFDIRFTDAQIEQIVSMQTVAPERKAAKTVVDGQTQRSKSRKAATR
jgi:hypothetical protein